jgi:alkanesulfonate monooxygenase SsuD/methylene tetrahydromethanopterin reductase-like flavin-dependent oxidoreductase (luciferase family)
VAEDAAVVDLLSGGRLTLAVGQGYAAAEFAGLGVDRRERASRLEEGIAVLRQAWDEPAVHHAGRHWHFDGVPVRPQPGRRLPLLVGAVAERAVERALVLTGSCTSRRTRIRPGPRLRRASPTWRASSARYASTRR